MKCKTGLSVLKRRKHKDESSNELYKLSNNGSSATPHKTSGCGITAHGILRNFGAPEFSNKQEPGTLLWDFVQVF